MVEGGCPPIQPYRPGFDGADLQEVGYGPGIFAEPRPDLQFVFSLDEMQGAVARAERAADDQESVIDEPVHELRVSVPVVLLPDRARVVPARTVNQDHREVSHIGTLPGATDTDGDSGWPTRD